MLRNLVFLLALIASSQTFAQTPLSAIPDKPDPAQHYLIYLHGKIVEEQGGPRPVSDTCGSSSRQHPASNTKRTLGRRRKLDTRNAIAPPFENPTTAMWSSGTPAAMSFSTWLTTAPANAM